MIRVALFPITGRAGVAGAGEAEVLELPAPEPNTTNPDREESMRPRYVVRRSWSDHSLSTPHTPYESLPTTDRAGAIRAALTLAGLAVAPLEVEAVEELDDAVRSVEVGAGVTFSTPAWRSFAAGVVWGGGLRRLRELVESPELLERLRPVIAGGAS